MSRPAAPIALWPLIVFDSLSVGGILAIHAGLGERIPTGVIAAEVFGVTAIGVATGFYWWKSVSRDTAADTPELETLRRENAENLKLLQDDLHNLGQAILKRLAHKAEAKPEHEHFEALAATVSDLAVNVAGTAADAAETKSAVFEMQAQLDQLSDALHTAGHATLAMKHIVDDDAGIGAPAAALSRAITAGAAGAAVARLIAGSSPARAATTESVGATDITPRHDEGESPAVLGGEFNAGATEQETFDEAERASAPGANPPSNLGEFTPDWDDVDFEGGEDSTAPAAVTPEPLEAGDEETRLTDQEESDIDWLTAGIPDAEAEEETEPMAASASQPELLAVEEAPRKPRRPAKGDTALIAHMMIGIGNKPYLRGIGPGLSTEKGVPMDYVDVGTWQWICPEQGAPVALSIWKNDELPASGDLIELEPGEIAETHPRFDSAN